MTVEQLLGDLDELVDPVRARLGKEKVTIFGHSWGSVLGVLYAARFPQKVAAYVGSGQIGDWALAEASSYAIALAEAQRLGNARAVKKLRAIGPPPYDWKSLFAERTWLQRLDGQLGPAALWKLGRMIVGAEESSIFELPRTLRGFEFSLDAMWADVSKINLLARAPALQVPVFFFLGRKDHFVPPETSVAYFDALTAPSKRIVWFEESGHEVFMDEPDRFNAAMVDLVLPVVTRRGTVPAPATGVHGSVAPGFEEVRDVFARNFAERGEIGAAVAAYWYGEKVVDLWGGRRTPDSDAPWNEDTLVIVHSTTKGLSALTLAVANARGWLDYDAPVASYWPEFAQNGKQAITVRQLLAHEAGLVLFDEKLTIDRLRDLDDVARVLARQKPSWQPGTRHGYHTMSIGLYMQELIRHVDPAKRTLGRFFHDEIAVPLGIEFYIGLPPGIPDERLARLKTLSRLRALLALPRTPPILIGKILEPGSLLRRSMLFTEVDPNDRRYLEVEVPAGNGVGTARAIARAYSAFAEGGRELGITPETMARLTAPSRPPTRDEVLGVPTCFTLGFARPGPEVAFGSSPRAFGTPGAGGSFAFADPDAHLGYAYVMNKMDFYLIDDPREKALRDALYRALIRCGRGRPRR